jgi:three-Cys-motif partner protein
MPKVDLAAYAGREQAYIKHCLLENYLPDWGYKIGSAWDNLIYVDGFAGPWKVTDPNLADSSFGVAINVLKQLQYGLAEKGRTINVRSILVERRISALQRLQDFAKRYSARGFDVHAVGGNFAAKINEITKLIDRSSGKTFKFVFSDPKGWKDIPMPALAPFLKGRGCEVLINLMARHAVRFLEQHDRKDSYDALFGRDEAVDVLRKTPKNRKLNIILREYCKSLKQLCGFQYVTAAAILEPNEEAIRYFLVFGTNHLRGIEVFKNAEKTAARMQDQVRFETIFRRKLYSQDTFFNAAPKTRIAYKLRDDYVKMAMENVIRVLLSHHGADPIPYRNLFALAMEFPLITPEDLIAGIKDLPSIKLSLEGARRRTPSVDMDDRVEIVDRNALANQLKSMQEKVFDTGNLFRSEE